MGLLKILRNPFRSDRLLMEITGSLIPEGTPLYKCGFCRAAVPGGEDFRVHARSHAATQFTSVEAIEGVQEDSRCTG